VESLTCRGRATLASVVAVWQWYSAAVVTSRLPIVSACSVGKIRSQLMLSLMSLLKPHHKTTANVCAVATVEGGHKGKGNFLLFVHKSTPKLPPLHPHLAPVLLRVFDRESAAVS